jgi:DNA-binding MarR family transcriptional regulator
VATHTAAAKALTQFVLAVFRLNSALIASGDRMTKDLQLTSARWQIMGALANEPLTASQIARNMGLYRQTVQPLVDALAADKLLEFIPNPNHRRARLIRMTPAGRTAYEEALARQISWSNEISRRLGVASFNEATELARELTQRLDDRAT